MENKKKTYYLFWIIHIVIVTILAMYIINRTFINPKGENVFNGSLSAEIPEGTNKMILTLDTSTPYDSISFVVQNDKLSSVNIQNKYEAELINNNTWMAQVDLAEYYSWMEYSVYAFTTVDGKPLVLTESSITVNPPFTLQVINGYWEMEFLLNTQEEYDAVKLAVWCTEKGLDDLSWYSAELNENNEWECIIPLFKHRSEGWYQIEIYTEKKGDKALFSKSMINVPSLPIDLLTAEIAEDLQTINITLQSIKRHSSIIFAVWPTNRGIKEVSYYEAEKTNDGFWTYNMELLPEEKDALFCIQAYSGRIENGRFLTTIDYEIPKGTCEVDISKDFSELEIRFYPMEKFTDVLFAVWSEENDQDELQWYTAEWDEDGFWVYKVNLYEYMTTGIYRIYTYVEGISVSSDTINVTSLPELTDINS